VSGGGAGLVLSLWLAAGPGPTPAAPANAFEALDGGARDELLGRLKAEPWPQRLAEAAGSFLGTRYVLSPLGEGEGRDADPLLRFDAFDCLTLVEESLALGLAPDEQGLVPVLNRIRYGGAPAWNTRLHVMESQWLPHQVQAGLLTDVTREYGGRATRRVTKVVTPATWRAPLGRSLHLEPRDQPVGTYALDIIPAARAAAALAHAPSGLVVVVVRADSPRLVTRVTHVAVLLQTPAGPALRHASRSYGKVVDEPLDRYLARSLEYGAWTVEGLALYRPGPGG
jgi:Protein of unknown function (DUF1460)